MAVGASLIHQHLTQGLSEPEGSLMVRHCPFGSPMRFMVLAFCTPPHCDTWLLWHIEVLPLGVWRDFLSLYLSVCVCVCEAAPSSVW